MDRHGVRNLFPVIVGGEDIERYKPDPMGLERALDLMSILPSQALYVGDHVVDAEAARRAGTLFVAVLSGFVAMDEFLPLPNVGILESVSRLPAFLSDGFLLAGADANLLSP